MSSVADPAAEGAHRAPARGLPGSRHPAVTHALLWSAAAGFLFSMLNVLARVVTVELHPLQAQFLRYAFGAAALLPWVLRRGLATWRTTQPGAQFTRGAVHTAGLALWFVALPHIPLADTTAIGFTTPIFIMIGAYLFLKEPMRWERWVASAIGFAGVLLVLAPKLGSGGHGWWHLVMLASGPVFAASSLLTKSLTRLESPEVIVLWQAIAISAYSLPLALWVWQWPAAWAWGAFVLAGLIGTAGHYCLTRSIAGADVSATQSLKFLDLLWAALMGWIFFTEVPMQHSIAGGVVICAATVWVAHRESKARRALVQEAAP